MKKRIVSVLLAAAVSITASCPAWASYKDCHDLVMSYIAHDQDPPQKPGDYLVHEDGTAHKLMSTTGYCQGSHGSHGDSMRIGYCASTPESYGSAILVYEAIPTDDGFELGEYITMLEVRDCGYGKSTGSGNSIVRKDKKYQGSIEAGKALDVYYPTLSECREWMRQTGGYIFAIVVPDVKG